MLLLAVAAGLTACGEGKKATVASNVAEPRMAAADIRAARRSSVNFKIFPLRVSTVRCQIPRGGPYVPGTMRLDGTCTTQVQTYSQEGNRGGHGTVGIVEVAFTERWRWPITGKRWWRATYIVLVRQGHVLKGETRTTGVAPPQSWL